MIGVDPVDRVLERRTQARGRDPQRHLGCPAGPDPAHRRLDRRLGCDRCVGRERGGAEVIVGHLLPCDAEVVEAPVAVPLERSEHRAAGIAGQAADEERDVPGGGGRERPHALEIRHAGRQVHLDPRSAHQGQQVPEVERGLLHHRRPREEAEVAGEHLTHPRVGKILQRRDGLLRDARAVHSEQAGGQIGGALQPIARRVGRRRERGPEVPLVNDLRQLGRQAGLHEPAADLPGPLPAVLRAGRVGVPAGEVQRYPCDARVLDEALEQRRAPGGLALERIVPRAHRDAADPRPGVGAPGAAREGIVGAEQLRAGPAPEAERVGLVPELEAQTGAHLALEQANGLEDEILIVGGIARRRGFEDGPAGTTGRPGLPAAREPPRRAFEADDDIGAAAGERLQGRAHRAQGLDELGIVAILVEQAADAPSHRSQRARQPGERLLRRVAARGEHGRGPEQPWQLPERLIRSHHEIGGDRRAVGGGRDLRRKPRRVEPPRSTRTVGGGEQQQRDCAGQVAREPHASPPAERGAVAVPGAQERPWAQRSVAASAA